MTLTHRRPVYAVLDPATDELTLATFQGEALVRMNRSEAVRLAGDILDLFDTTAALSSPSVAESPTPTLVTALKGIGLELFADEPTPQPDGTVDRYGCHWDVAPFTGCGAQAPTWETALIETLRCAMVLVEHLRKASAPSPSAAVQPETP